MIWAMTVWMLATLAAGQGTVLTQDTMTFESRADCLAEREALWQAHRDLDRAAGTGVLVGGCKVVDSPRRPSPR